MPGWLSLLLPRPGGDLDRDPIALLLGAAAAGLALVYLALVAVDAQPRVRAAVLGLAAALLVVLPSAAFIAMGFATDRPYGQDGGVVQLPLALDRILAGQSPYGADYSGTILGRIARASSFWEPYGGNPILRHHAYLPGTHLVMMPFYLLCRSAKGAFDPRFVTLLAYGLVVLLAARLPESAPARLSAAAVAALNPLVYWHQVFGANDLVFVAMLLAVVHATRRGQSTAAGAWLGLACATKQLAWPFAPFLLLALSGAASFPELVRRETWERLARPLLAAALVFGAVVLPVAALDFRAFYGDIVAYNVGLPGADNYPLGGTPGFGFANFLIYFGRVASLRDYVPFGAFYLLLVPLGLLLAHRQVRARAPEAALVLGTVALLASLYFSRVVHPNYLISAAVLLPVGLLARGRDPDLAIVPLLLLGLAVEIVENGLFKEVWQQAAASGQAAIATGLPGWLLPRAGPSLTEDPLGLLLGAVAAGLALAYLVAGHTGASPRVRTGMVAVAAGLLVVVPTFVVVRVGERTGVPRAQDAWVVRAWADAGRLAAWTSPYAPPPAETPRGREAWSSSFRFEPANELLPAPPLVPPGAATLTALVGPLVGHDPRLLVLMALGLLAVVVVRATGANTPLALAAALLLPPLALGTVFGSPVALALAALAAAWAAAQAGRALIAGLLAGLACAIDPYALFAAPFLLTPLARSGFPWRRVLAGFAAGFGALVLPAVALGPGPILDRLAQGLATGPGIGLVNILLFRGADDAFPLAMLLVGPVLAGAILLPLLRKGGITPLAGGAIGLLLALWLAPAAPPEALAGPLFLLALDGIDSFRASLALPGVGEASL
jgi:hypothetical protein